MSEQAKAKKEMFEQLGHASQMIAEIKIALEIAQARYKAGDISKEVLDEASEMYEKMKKHKDIMNRNFNTFEKFEKLRKKYT